MSAEPWDANDTDPMFDLTAERSVLGAAMTGWYREAAEVVKGADFYEPRHQTVWETIAAQVDASVTVSPITVNDALRGTRPGLRLLTQDPSFVARLYGSAAVSGSVTHHAGIVADMAALRRMDAAGQRIRQRVAERPDVPELVTWARAEIEAVVADRIGVDRLVQPMWDFMAEHDPLPNWLIWGLLELGDRAVFTGAGGIGKSTLCRQINVCAAAGLHPFTGRALPRQLRVMVVDKENPDPRNRRQYQPLLDLAARDTNGEGVGDRMFISGRDERLNLLDPTHAMSLLRTVERVKPDLVYIGPYYKLHGATDPDREETVQRFTGVLDQVVQTGAAVLTEAHPNKAAHLGGNMAPAGSHVWTAWPDYGFGLRQDPEASSRRVFVERWRLDREEYSEWPDVLESSGPGMWPWSEGAPR